MNKELIDMVNVMTYKIMSQISSKYDGIKNNLAKSRKCNTTNMPPNKYYWEISRTNL